MLMGVSGPVANAVIERQYLPPRRPPSEILQHVAADRQQPGAELTLPAKPVHAPKRADERLLHQIVDVRLGRAGTSQKTRQGPSVTPDQFGRRLFVAPLPRPNQRGVGRGDCWNYVRVGHRAPDVDVRQAPILRKVPGVRCLVSGVTPLTPGTRHQTPCLTETRRIASKFEQTFETSCDHTTSVSTTCSPARPGSSRTRSPFHPHSGTRGPDPGFPCRDV